MKPTPISLAKVAKVQPHLTTASGDGWLLGGASLVVWVLMSLFDGMGRSLWVIDRQFSNLTAVAGTLALLLTYPHVMASYRLAYSQSQGLLRRYWVQLIALPFVLAMAIMASYFLYTIAPSEPLAQRLNGLIRGLGLQTTLGLQPTIGGEAMGMLVHVMLAMVGWHCARQAFLCTRVMAHYEGCELSRMSWVLLRVTLIGVWLSGFANTNIGPLEHEFMGITHANLGFPVGSSGVLCALSAIAGTAFTFTVLNRTNESGSRPSVSVLIAPIAYTAWWFPPFVHDAFLLQMVPVFHAIQYLTLVHKVEKQASIKSDKRSHPMRNGIRILMVIGLGFAAFEIVPACLDHVLNTADALGVSFFVAAAALFLTIHHCAIDHAVWRFRNPIIRGLVRG